MKAPGRIYALILIPVLLASCTAAPSGLTVSDETVPMYPDYTDITVPVNIAPLNFLLREDASRVCVYADGVRIAGAYGSKICFNGRKWRRLLEENADRTMEIKVCARTADGWKEFRHFTWTVSSDRIDPYLTYRIIEPDYETFNEIALQQRHTESFDTDNFCDYRVIGNKCMNCHTFSSCRPDISMFYVRGEGGGAFLNTGGTLQKLNLKEKDMVTGSVYFGFSPSGRYITFSTNHVIPGYHGKAGGRMEVYDTESDVYVADLQQHTFLRAGTLCRPEVLETFPCFSPDGKYVYYCAAEKPDTFDFAGIRSIRYSLCRTGFDESTGSVSGQTDTVFDAAVQGRSVCHPRVSPDGRFLCFSTADYGTFPLWHAESDLALMDLESLEVIPMEAACSDKSDTYHSWSGNSRWIVFASKRDDGVYGKPYFTHIDSSGNCTKAFVLPQKHPDFYDNYLRSFNTPELGSGPLPFSTWDVKEALGQKAVEFRYETDRHK